MQCHFCFIFYFHFLAINFYWTGMWHDDLLIYCTVLGSQMIRRESCSVSQIVFWLPIPTKAESIVTMPLSSFHRTANIFLHEISYWIFYFVWFQYPQNIDKESFTSLVGTWILLYNVTLVRGHHLILSIAVDNRWILLRIQLVPVNLLSLVRITNGY